MRTFLWLAFIFVYWPAAIMAGAGPSNNSTEKQRGVSWVGGPRISSSDLHPLVENHVNWIVQTPFGWQRHHNSPEIRLVTSGNIYWGETDDGLRTTTSMAQKLGIKTLLKPHIWLSNTAGGKWRGEVEMDSEEDWQRWFENYRRFIMHYAKLAQETGMEALAIGTELRMAAVTRPEDWRRLIQEVRQIYHGQITYSANWYLEFEEVAFWDALDFIGIQGYFPLSDKEHPTLDELISGWKPHVEQIRKVSEEFDKPVVFTEVGYKSTADTAIEPWKWPRFSFAGSATSQELQTQAVCYEAFFQTFWHKPWVGGSFIWKWHPKPRSNGRDRGFTPQNKPAQQVLARWYRPADF